MVDSGIWTGHLWRTRRGDTDTFIIQNTNDSAQTCKLFAPWSKKINTDYCIEFFFENFFWRKILKIKKSKAPKRNAEFDKTMQKLESILELMIDSYPFFLHLVQLSCLLVLFCVLCSQDLVKRSTIVSASRRLPNLCPTFHSCSLTRRLYLVSTHNYNAEYMPMQWQRGCSKIRRG